jgi:hypothetical protein
MPSHPHFMTKLLRKISIFGIFLAFLTSGVAGLSVFALETDIDEDALKLLNQNATTGLHSGLLETQAVVTPPVTPPTTSIPPVPSDCTTRFDVDGCPCQGGYYLNAKCIASTTTNTPSGSTPSPSSTTGCTGGDLKSCWNVFRAKCIFPYQPPSGGAGDLCADDESVVGILKAYLSNIIPYLAVLVIVAAGYVYYASSSSGDSKRATGAIRAAASGLVLLLFTQVVGEILGALGKQTSTDPNANKGLNVLLSSNGQLAGLLVTLITKVFGMLQFAAGAFAVVSILYAGYLYILSNFMGKGSDGAAARTALKNGVIGIIVTLLAVTIIGVTQNFAQQFIK